MRTFEWYNGVKIVLKSHMISTVLNFQPSKDIDKLSDKMADILKMLWSQCTSKEIGAHEEMFIYSCQKFKV